MTSYENLSVHDQENDEDGKFKSKNLQAERRRREKLSNRLLELRALVPKISNLTKETIIVDAIGYIEELKGCNEDLSNQLYEIEATLEEDIVNPMHDFHNLEEMKRWVIEPEIKVDKIEGNKLWMKILFEKKRGGFTKMIEAMNIIGYEFSDTSLITCEGAHLITACLVKKYGGRIEADRVKGLLLEIANGI